MIFRPGQILAAPVKVILADASDVCQDPVKVHWKKYHGATESSHLNPSSRGHQETPRGDPGRSQEASGGRHDEHQGQPQVWGPHRTSRGEASQK